MVLATSENLYVRKQHGGLARCMAMPGLVRLPRWDEKVGAVSCIEDNRGRLLSKFSAYTNKAGCFLQDHEEDNRRRLLSKFNAYTNKAGCFLQDHEIIGPRDIRILYFNHLELCERPALRRARGGVHQPRRGVSSLSGSCRA